MYLLGGIFLLLPKIDDVSSGTNGENDSGEEDY